MSKWKVILNLLKEEWYDDKKGLLIAQIVIDFVFIGSVSVFVISFLISCVIGTIWLREEYLEFYAKKSLQNIDHVKNVGR